VHFLSRRGRRAVSRHTFTALVPAFLVALGATACGDTGDEQSPPPCTPFAEPAMVLVDAGEYMIGNSEYLRREVDATIDFTVAMRPPHVTVELPYSFLVQNTEVTRGDFRRIMGYDPSPELAFRDYFFERPEGVFIEDCGPDCPLQRVTWFESLAYANELSRSEGLVPCYDLGECTGVPADGDFWCDGVPEWTTDCKGYRLPTSVEWEVAARAGTTWDYLWAPVQRVWPNQRYAMVTNGVLVPGVSGYRPYPVGSLCPNAWGLYDVQGNAAEWVMDGPYGATDDPRTASFRWPEDGATATWFPGDSEYRESRGGHASSGVYPSGLGVRSPVYPVSQNSLQLFHQGLRLVRFGEWKSTE
jgi:formylglycine-generating enzyme required for sulfatase activity